ncbi:hypothetical protein AB0N05_38725 [Nocardia sp. NPDC051030]|uniref:hypothetical protein n=1 Tax=Nocardia sp. NPDC051030 TaxID=3155162 RepID=UPI003437A074
MIRISRLAAAALFAGALVTGVAAGASAAPVGSTGIVKAAEQEPLGPFAQESECLSRGNRGIENGEWNDYECVGGAGNWNVQPK